MTTMTEGRTGQAVRWLLIAGEALIGLGVFVVALPWLQAAIVGIPFGGRPLAAYGIVAVIAFIGTIGIVVLRRSTRRVLRSPPSAGGSVSRRAP